MTELLKDAIDNAMKASCLRSAVPGSCSCEKCKRRTTSRKHWTRQGTRQCSRMVERLTRVDHTLACQHILPRTISHNGVRDYWMVATVDMERVAPQTTQLKEVRGELGRFKLAQQDVATVRGKDELTWLEVTVKILQ